MLIYLSDDPGLRLAGTDIPCVAEIQASEGAALKPR
jgi:hypothetical protein